ncbi:hypothetical protein [Nocardia gipuzkoensis]|uniref:hypothetical protein n=1 Tax=Nocardia gipuzkoensis TaxID=2749991 RepID=UPI00237DB42E|nr:hypothetical protein [Nocardia gipuzkoensis]MDE1673811.1 hypothetical protein [Nocardia gipuzkoensis]
MPDRDRLVALLAEHLYERGDYVPDWPEDERALHRDMDAWDSFTERAAKVTRLRFEKAANAIIAAGWRPPARRIETAEELEALPFDVLIQDKWGTAWQRRSHGNWARLAVKRSDAPMRIVLPAAVLWEPKETTP